MRTNNDEQQGRMIAAEYRLPITRAEAEAGVVRTVRFHGADGHERSVAVTVPAGATTGMRLPVEIPAQAEAFGLSYGALVVVLTVLPHVSTECRGSDVYMALQADRASAERDGEVRVPLEDGRVLAVPVRPGVTHDRFVYYGQGLARGSAPLRRGDLILHLELLDVEAPGNRLAPEPIEAPRAWWRTLLRME